MRVGVIQFPGTNCEYDARWAFEKLGASAEVFWHTQDSISKEIDLVVVAGGFSYGDYLRSGAIAKFSPIMRALKDYSAKGGKVLGICNGFQILTEARMLPGALMRNSTLHFISKLQHLRVINNNNTFLKELNVGDVLNIPIAHQEGNYYIDDDGLKALYDNEQVLLKYCDANGGEDNPNGSIDAIAGICNREKNIFGLMPHPERAMEKLIGSNDGLKMLEGFFKA